METTKAMILEWEKRLRENDNRPLPKVFFSYDDEQNEKEAIILFKYAFEKILQWTPEDARNNLNKEIIEKLKLKRVYKKIIFPRGLSYRGDYWYVAKKCYPDKIHGCGKEDIWKMLYLNVLANPNGKYPKEYFCDADGKLKAKLFLMHQLENYVRFSNIEEMYKFFSSTAEANEFLKECKLLPAMKVHFDSPLEYMHESLPVEQRDNLLLMFTEFQNMDK